MNQRKRSPISLILTLRQQKEDTEETALARALAGRQQATLRIEQLRASCESVAQERRAAVNSVVTGAEYTEQTAFHNSLKLRLEEALCARAPLEEKCEEQRRLYREARCQREVISELLHRREEAYRADQERAEQKRSHDLFLARIALKRNSAVHNSTPAEYTRKATENREPEQGTGETKC